eukprot:gene20270-39973_t
MRYVEHDNKLVKLISCPKLRGSAHSNEVRTFHTMADAIEIVKHGSQDDVRLKEAIDSLVGAIREEHSGDVEVAALTTLVSQLRDANQHLVLAAVRAQVRQDEAEARNRQQNEFLAMLAHELRNPLAPISAAAQLLKMPGVDERRVQQSSDVISRQVKHMTELVDDLLDLSRVTRGLVTLTRKSLDLKRVVASAVEQAHPAIEARKHALSLRLGEHPAADADGTAEPETSSRRDGAPLPHLTRAAAAGEGDGRGMVLVAATGAFGDASLVRRDVGVDQAELGPHGQGDPEGVEPGTEVGRRCRHAHDHLGIILGTPAL